jgi:SAM-dependent methyltransferase
LRRLARLLRRVVGPEPPAPAAAPLSSLEHLARAIEGVLGPASGLYFDESLWTEISPYLETDRISNTGVFDLVDQAFSPERNRLLDFGCGDGNYRAGLEAQGWEWTGVDYLPAVARRARERVAAQADARLHLYDGRCLPFADAAFDLAFSMLVFEHIQHIDLSLCEIARVLAPGGRVVGSVAYLEPTHDYSTFNFTPIGLKTAAGRNGLVLRRVYPAYDAFTFLLSRLAAVSVHGAAEPLWAAVNDPQNVWHRAVAAMADRPGVGFAELNMLKLQFSAHLTFELEKA